MKLKTALLLSVCAIVVLGAWLLQADAPGTVASADDPQSTAAGAAGMKVYIDPVTGEFLEGPPEPVRAETVKDINDRFSTSTEGLQQVPAPVGGGVMVDLRGRFQQTVKAAIDDSGKVTVGCDRHDADDEADSDRGKE
jgi:hypothetical protein